MAESKKKEERLKDLSDKRLVSKYKFQVRETWEKALARRTLGNPRHDPLYKSELALQREILRRLEEKRERKVTILVRGPYSEGSTHDQRLMFRATVNELVTVPAEVANDRVKLMKIIGISPREGVDLKEFVKHIERVFEFTIIHEG